ncbi:glycosyltransferase [Alkalihalobacillus sp. AL-G]|uniref:glycosyltransferase n=1 Tax=Alkalihalobacillus sp. AL-G TaxID=2926399 RepID=UPI00272A0251|nr:glycosyltransferase [Alkalihalobacillus sp. AL-G]WLD94956.1 glycosyltransferase [Alkalihalobacillus sp. AL-G]
MNGLDPKISVIIPFYNCSFVHEAIESVLNQTYKNIEIIVIDDGSKINTERLKPYMNKVSYFYQENGGTASALNQGIKRSTGDFIAWLSSDDVFLPEKLEKQVDFMIKSNSDLVYTNFSLINARSEIIRENVGLILHDRVRFLKQLQKSCPINGSTILVKKEIIPQVGWFDSELKYTQDYDMWIRISAKFKVSVLDETVLHYRIHDNMGSKRFTEDQWKEIKLVQEKYQGMLSRLIHIEEKGLRSKSNDKKV